jgi:hypothetical protein
MAAGDPGAAFGGDRVFAADPNNTGLPAVIGDLAALNLQMAHFMRHTADDADKVRIDAIAARTRQVLAASQASQARESATRELQPVTRVPAVPYGIEENIANIRMINIPTFTGTTADTIEIVHWISRIFNLAQSKQLSYAATINLLIQGASKGAANYIDEMKEEGRTLAQIVQQLEMRFGSLTTVADARVRCNNMPRTANENLSDFIDRLRLTARMACRGEPDEAERRKAINTLVEGNIRRVLPSSVRNQLEERIMNRSLMGLPELSSRDVEKECLDLEKKRLERKMELRAAPMAQVKKHQNINRAAADVDSDGNTSDSSDEDVPEDDNPQEYLINQISQYRERYVQRGRPVNGPKVFKRAFKNYNNKFYGKGPGKPAQFGARQLAAGAAINNPAPRQQGPPNHMEGLGFKPIYELLAMANCAKGQCIQCGFDGHLMRNMACALKDKPLTDRVCAKCSKGLHSADDCPKVFQQQFQAPAPVQGANLIVNGEPLNEK